MLFYFKQHIDPVFQYLVATDDLHPELLVVQCVECRIPFLASKTNKGRKDLRCPMGCRAYRKKEQSKKRSTEYYQDEIGKKKKQEQNQKRKNKGRPPPVAPSVDSSIRSELQLRIYIYFLIRLLKHREMPRSEVQKIYDVIQAEVRQHPFE